METVEVISSAQRRRRWTAEQKKAMVLEAEQPEMSISAVARKYEVHYYSTESNGMAAAFIKTFRRDYVDAHPLYDARYVLEQLPKWFEDYNEHHPHKALKMKSPREYQRYAADLDECPAK